MKISTPGLVLRGMAMGIAEVIPGVSGGTIAFITGIYKTLIDSIKSVDFSLIKILFSGQWLSFWQKLNGPFLLPLAGGMLLGIVTGVFGVTHLLENYPEALWALFFGLILASVPYMLTQMHDKKWMHVLPFVLGAIIAYLLTSLSPAEGSTNYLYIFLAGVIAISALVLPGISGSFILLLLGLYTVIIPTVKSLLSSPNLSDFLMLFVFGVGCLVGLAGFSRIVSAAFEKFHDATIALMSGFMLGSLNKIWPWRNPSQILNKETGIYTEINAQNISTFDYQAENLKVVADTNVWYQDYFGSPSPGLVLGSFFLGLLIVLILFISSRKSVA